MKLEMAASGLLGLIGLLACSAGDEAPAVDTDNSSNTPRGQAGTTSALPRTSGGVAGYERPPGMPIGRGVPSSEDQSIDPMLGGSGGGTNEDSDDVEIPIFETPEREAPPCSGCVELNVDVDDINQRDDFVFSAGGVNVTRVVWTLIIPFNSDQLFVQPFVDSAYGTYTDLDANAFAAGELTTLVHQYSGAANNVGIAIGSAGAWTGDMTMSVFVDGVTLEGAAATASRTFDSDAEGLATRSAAHNPKIVFHP